MPPGQLASSTAPAGVRETGAGRSLPVGTGRLGYKDSMTTSPAAPDPATDHNRAARFHWWIVVALQGLLAVELLLTLLRGQWLNAFLIGVIIAVAQAPALLHRLTDVRIPPEFQLLAVIFVFAALFLGEVRGFYTRFWWWDLVLHTSSGVLLGIVGFLLVYVLNESEQIELYMRPHFLALFAVVFAVAVGALWEIFEFGMDRLFGMSMQKPMLGDPSGLTDTMWDLIVDTLGALLVGGLGWWYLCRRRLFLIERWVHRFIARHPQLFGGRPRP